MEVRTIRPDELEDAASLLTHSYQRAGGAAPWADEQGALALLRRDLEQTPDGVLVADAGGAVAGVGCVRVRGEVSTLGPLAVASENRGTGSALVDGLLELADAKGSHAVRAHVEGSNAAAFALLAGRGFATVDIAIDLERPPGEPPVLDSSRGLELAAPRPEDFEEVVRMDERLTGHARVLDLGASLSLIARRRGTLVGWLARTGNALGPAMAIDGSDLFIIIARAISPDIGVRARLSTAAPAATMAALGLGFRVGQVGVVLSRGTPPPTRPPQLYSLDPIVL